MKHFLFFNGSDLWNSKDFHFIYKPNQSWIFVSRDPGYFDAIDKIGQHFFGLPEPQRPRGMFSGLMDSFFSGNYSINLLFATCVIPNFRA